MRRCGGVRAGWWMEEEPPCYRLQMQPCCQHLAQGTGAQPLPSATTWDWKATECNKNARMAVALCATQRGRARSNWNLGCNWSQQNTLLYHTAQNTDSLMFDHLTVLYPTLQQLQGLKSARCCRRQHGDVQLESNWNLGCCPIHRSCQGWKARRGRRGDTV